MRPGLNYMGWNIFFSSFWHHNNICQEVLQKNSKSRPSHYSGSILGSRQSVPLVVRNKIKGVAPFRNQKIQKTEIAPLPLLKSAYFRRKSALENSGNRFSKLGPTLAIGPYLFSCNHSIASSVLLNKLLRVAIGVCCRRPLWQSGFIAKHCYVAAYYHVL